MLALRKLLNGNVLRLISSDPDYERDYQLWREHNLLTAEVYLRMGESSERLDARPLISVIIPVYDPPLAYLEQAIFSVINQVYPTWELCIADDFSSNPEIRLLLEKFRAMDNRIKVVYGNRSGQVSAASNSAIQLANGKYIAFVDHADVLTPDALFEVAVLINEHPEADLIYTDEDKLDLKGKPATPYFKPDWSPDSLLSRMYMGHLAVYRRKIVNEIGGLRAGFEGNQDHDLALRFVENTNAIYHIPKILYHARIHSEFAPLTNDHISATGQTAIKEAMQRRGEPGEVEPLPAYKGGYRVRYSLHARELVSIIVLTRDLASTLQKCLESIFNKSSYENFEVLQVDNGSQELATKELFEHWMRVEPDRYRVINCNIPFNFSKINNIAVQHARGSYILFLNNDTEVISQDWLEGLLEQAQRKSVGAVGAKLFYPDGTIQHAGVVIGLGNLQTAGHVFQGYPTDHSGYFGSSVVTTNFSALTAACLMCRKENFIIVGGFDENLGVAYNDVDLCLKLRKKHLDVVFTPHVQLFHHESRSRGYEDTEVKRTRLKAEADILKKKWGYYLAHDQYYNPNLSRILGDYRINLKG